MEWIVEVVLPQEVRKLTSATEEKDAVIALLTDDLQGREYENVALQAQRDVYQAELQKCQDTITHLNPIQDGHFPGCSWMRGGGAKRCPLPKICHIYPTMMKLDTVIPHLKKTQKIYESRDTTPEFC